MGEGVWVGVSVCGAVGEAVAVSVGACVAVCVSEGVADAVGVSEAVGTSTDSPGLVGIWQASRRRMEERRKIFWRVR